MIILSLRHVRIHVVLSFQFRGKLFQKVIRVIGEGSGTGFLNELPDGTRPKAVIFQSLAHLATKKGSGSARLRNPRF